MTWTAKGMLYDTPLLLEWGDDGPINPPILLAANVDAYEGKALEFAPGVGPIVVSLDDPASWVAVLMALGTLYELTGPGAPVMVPPLPEGAIG